MWKLGEPETLHYFQAIAGFTGQSGEKIVAEALVDHAMLAGVTVPEELLRKVTLARPGGFSQST